MEQPCSHSHTQDCVHCDDLSPILIEVLQDNLPQVTAWLQNESGSWRFLADQAVASRETQCQRPLSESETRLVQDRLWWLLDQLKQQVSP